MRVESINAKDDLNRKDTRAELKVWYGMVCIVEVVVVVFVVEVVVLASHAYSWNLLEKSFDPAIIIQHVFEVAARPIEGCIGKIADPLLRAIP
jgi:nucleoside recognition membrane protein YjiH